MERYLCHFFYRDERDASVRSIGPLHPGQKTAHLHRAAELLRRYENKDWQPATPGGKFPLAALVWRHARLCQAGAFAADGADGRPRGLCAGIRAAAGACLQNRNDAPHR
jgi:hypothetical protein